MTADLIKWPCGCFVSVPEDPIDGIINTPTIHLCPGHAAAAGFDAKAIQGEADAARSELAAERETAKAAYHLLDLALRPVTQPAGRTRWIGWVETFFKNHPEKRERSP